MTGSENALSLRERFRALYFRSRLFRKLAPLFMKNLPPELDDAHLRSFREEQIGPLQRDEALALFALTRVQRPQTIVEFGFLNGHSALNFLLAADPACHVYSYDVSPRSQEIAERCMGHFPHFKFLFKSQADFVPEDVDHRMIDLCFLDASHDLALNRRTFELILPLLSENSLLVIHDTGVWHRDHFRSNHREFVVTDVGRTMGRWLDDNRFQACFEERKFVNELRQHYPEFAQIHLHSTSTLRNGLTLLQRSRTLETEPAK